ncbi:putative NAD(P)-binding oxidoreductase with NAD(P)-binding Rossmann-fold domain (modular protein) [Paraburkholderia unamae]|uniref:SDR family NAD(P)-dependent oxidoreductase n=1 Tax=Paraburkholderia unamae TaxID=219649 RepID=UPI001CB6317D|nr:SDR family NAD(P)-dependent oxidoreductase [Paraburkholderia unamae]CAG9246096.1 putative NAD(P)-binding oxidoreductase with NAD(P)-binding Rossmann-fold domain (modular protein) [Paraburkholderia unamae]
MTKTLVITGGSRGIGAAVAKLAAKDGFAVCVGYRADAAAAAKVVSEIERPGGKAIAVMVDFASENDVIRLFTHAQSTLGPIAALVNSAAMVERHSSVADLSHGRLQRIFAVNAIGPFLCCREAVRRMSIRHGGTGGAIVNVSSSSARMGSPHEYVDYAATKGALETLTIGLSKEVARDGSRVNGVRPGHIYTEMHASGGEPERVDRLTDPRILTLSLCYFGINMGLYGVIFWLPQICTAVGFSDAALGYMVAVPYVVAAIGMVWWCHHSDRSRERAWHIAGASLVGCLGLALSAFVPDSPVSLVIAISFGALGTLALPPIFWTLPAAILSSPAAAGGIALINALGNIGGFAGPFMVGWIKGATGSYSYGLLAIAASLLLPGLVALVLGHDTAAEHGHTR